MEITINLVEAATELAHRDVVNAYDADPNLFPNGSMDDTPEGGCYTPEAQKFFDQKYDFYWDFLYDLAT